LFLGAVQLSQLFKYLTQVKRNEVAVEEGYFFPVLSSHPPVYIYSFINEIQAVHNPTGTSIPVGKRIKAKLYESKHRYMVEDVNLYSKAY
jgi:hypothetical protein